MTELVGLFIILSAVIIIVFLIALYYTNSMASELHNRVDNIVEALSETISVVNTNSDMQKVSAQYTQENNVDIAMIKRILEVHGRAINVSVPRREWEALLESIKVKDD